MHILRTSGEREQVDLALVKLANVGQENVEDIAELSNLNEPSLMEKPEQQYLCCHVRASIQVSRSD